MIITNVDYETLTKMLLGSADLVLKNRDMLCRLDAIIGDGDHGVTMERVMKIIIKKIEESTKNEITILLQDIAWALIDCDGGATGPLFGSLFLGMSDATAGKSNLDGIALAGMMEGGMKAIMEQSKAAVGDKTMMDALIPAVDAAEQAAQENAGIDDILKAAAKAAKAGSDYTATIPARYGRAKFQGERTIGHPDPGSVSVSLIFQGFVNGLEIVED